MGHPPGHDILVMTARPRAYAVAIGHDCPGKSDQHADQCGDRNNHFDVHDFRLTVIGIP